MVACLARSSLVAPGLGVADLAHRAGHVHQQQHPGRLALVLPVVEQLREHVGLGHLEQRLRLVRVDAVAGGDRVADGDLRVPRPEAVAQDLLLVGGLAARSR